MKFIKAHKLFFICLFIFIVLAIIAFAILQKYIIFNGDVYGNRLDGIKEVKLDDKISDIEKGFMEKEDIAKSHAYVTGRILNIVNEMKSDSTIDTLKGYKDIVLQKLSEEEKKFYDIQIIYNKEGAENLYPVFGYFAKGSTDFKWSYRS